jgi:hypothetical protein
MEVGRFHEEFQPEELYPAWCWIDDLERAGVIGVNDALQWKAGIYELMERWGLGRMIWLRG